MLQTHQKGWVNADLSNFENEWFVIPKTNAYENCTLANKVVSQSDRG